MVYTERKEPTGESETLNKTSEEQSKDQNYTTPQDTAIIDGKATFQDTVFTKCVI